ncbi:ESX secretion-associated protein EspG [Nocardia macrotermitis]|uniref:ESX-1 secretion-associated protein EspG1 n=1 Tax=Nocardia macrotermitis TaxID=2585198 RepID=A0A7K0D9B3_9NOCA|nr:ESX secretion-associated protein EspG [Nocardia macrotermitis]MQY22360.1 ESX-1 secretion-associated protein EspG1 [Nocardia macrotermitis]
MLESVVLTLDEMQFLLDKLQISQVPVVLDTLARYDSDVRRKEAFDAAAESLAARDLLDGEFVHRDLEDRMRALDRPHWAVAVRWYVGGLVNRLCIAKGDEMEVVVLRGPDTYVVSEASHDLPGTIVAALGPADPLELEGMNVLTEELEPILKDAGDSNATAKRLSKVGHPPRDAHTLAAALVEVPSHASIVGVVYSDGSRDIADGAVAVFNTRNGRFITTTTRSDDDVQWTSLSTGTSGRLRTAIKDLIEKLPLREEFNPPAGAI